MDFIHCVISQCNAVIDLIITVGHNDLYCFCGSTLFAKFHFIRRIDELMSNFWIMSPCDATVYLKINISLSDLYFMVQ